MQYVNRSIGKTVNNLVRVRTYQFHVIAMDDKLIDEWIKNQTAKNRSCLKSSYKHFDCKKIAADYRPGGKYRNDLSFLFNLITYKFWPLIRIDQKKRRYTKNIKNKLEIKQKKRPIMYPAHRDSCVMSFYAFLLKGNYESMIKNTKLANCVLGYRKIPVNSRRSKNKSNINFANDLYDSLQYMNSHVVLCIDIKGFFDNINHAMLKDSMTPFSQNVPAKNLEIILKNVTKYRYVFAEDVKQLLGSRSWINPGLYNKVLRDTSLIHKNKKPYGIPQGTPISDILSNIYMYNFDKAVIAELESMEEFTLYRRYCDDILVAIPCRYANKIYNFLSNEIEKYKLKIGADKTEAFYINAKDKVLKDITREYVKDYRKNKVFIQYLGFYMNLDKIIIRSSTVEAHYRKIKNIEGTRRYIDGSINENHFDSYEKNSSKIIDNKSIRKQVSNIKKHTKKILRTNAKNKS